MSERNNVSVVCLGGSSAQPTDPHVHHLASCSPHRILHLYAKENAIDDTIYYLSEALRKGVISLDVFLKVTACLCVFMCAGMCGGGCMSLNSSFPSPPSPLPSPPSSLPLFSMSVRSLESSS